ncbi:Hypothetical protein CINCED_3A003180 [Cinara cedri]|uniref:Protein kinase domain-containing protein n=1 Tax=Cinara cedri TaxID=506608 RepID=A0A5E4NNA4_9HEMI|nr:Hypothetical protein CINCED_3A003180 [Cinara cedri]
MRIVDRRQRAPTGLDEEYESSTIPMTIISHSFSMVNIGRRTGSCVDMKPCGLEAACKQIDINTYRCICPYDKSQPTEDGKCPRRMTVPVNPKPFINLSINKNEQKSPQPTLLNYTATKTTTTKTTPSITTTTSYPINTTNDVFNYNATFFPWKEQLDVNLFGYMLRLNLFMLVAALIAIILTVVFILIACLTRKTKCCCKKKNVNKTDPPVVPLMKGILQDDCFALNPQYDSPTPKTKETILIPYLSKSCISSMEEIGQGFFGQVFRGIMKHRDGRLETVAIKMLKDHSNSEAKEDFMREVEIMTYFRHPNILTLIGVCPEENKCSPWMIFEFMEFGDLTSVLRNSSDQFTIGSPSLPSLNRDALLIISLQISAGMKYLASQRFVHRDLACRNCLVSHNLTVKIADFGMSRDIYTCDYYKVGGSRLLPVRWMSPESVVYGKFTLESDVWSFGVVLWEIYSLGKQPYYGYSNDEVLKIIHDGILLDIPLNCPPVICVLMNGCWKSDPKERLRFVDIHERLKNVTRQPELDSPLPRPPALPAIVDHLSLRKIPSEELLDVDNYLQPDEPDNTVEYIMPLPY